MNKKLCCILTMNKKILRIVLVSCIASSLFATGAFAVDIAPTAKRYVSAEYAASQMPRYGEMEKVVDMITTTKTVKLLPENQPSNGYTLPNGGSVYIQTGKGATADIGISFPLPKWKSVSISVGYGRATGDQVTGLAVNLPRDHGRYKVILQKTLKVTQKECESYRYNEYQYTYFTTSYEVTNIAAWPVAASAVPSDVLQP